MRKIIRDESKKILSRRNRPLKENKLDRLIKEELLTVLKESKEEAPDIAKKLEELRNKLIETGAICYSQRGSGTVTRAARPEHRIALDTVVEVTGIPRNTLMLHFLNGHRVTEGYGEMVEYHGGQVYFYGHLEEKTLE